MLLSAFCFTFYEQFEKNWEKKRLNFMSVCLSEWNSCAPIGQILIKFDIWAFSKIRRKRSSFTKIRQERRVLYMKTSSRLWQYLAKLFLEWEIFQIKVVEKIKTHILCSITFLFANVAVYETTSKNVAQPEGPQITSQYGAYKLHAGQARLHARTRMHTHTHPGIHTHAYTHKYVTLVFPRWQ
jgi:hypothetical protein